MCEAPCRGNQWIEEPVSEELLPKTTLKAPICHRLRLLECAGALSRGKVEAASPIRQGQKSKRRNRDAEIETQR